MPLILLLLRQQDRKKKDRREKSPNLIATFWYHICCTADGDDGRKLSSTAALWSIWSLKKRKKGNSTTFAHQNDGSFSTFHLSNKEETQRKEMSLFCFKASGWSGFITLRARMMKLISAQVRKQFDTFNSSIGLPRLSSGSLVLSLRPCQVFFSSLLLCDYWPPTASGL